MLRRSAFRIVASAVLLGIATLPALAHSGSSAGGFIGGFAHPLFGPDHVVAMVAVGLWGAFLGAPAIWLLPIVFPLVMAAGGAIGILGVPLPAVETGIAASAVVLGMMVALAARPPLWVAAVLVGVFAIFHGHAHGSRIAAGSGRRRLFGRLRHRHRIAASRRHRVRAAGALAGRPPCGARGRRGDRGRGTGLFERHGMSVDAFVGGLLNPLTVPAHVLTLVGVGLLIGTQPRGRFCPRFRSRPDWPSA